MAKDYKRTAICNALIEMYCSSNKYRVKNTELLEKSQPKNKEWINLRERYKQDIQNQLADILPQDLPKSLERSIANITEHYNKYLDVMDLDTATKKHVTTVFSALSDKYIDKEPLLDLTQQPSSDDESVQSDCPGLAIQRKKRKAAKTLNADLERQKEVDKARAQANLERALSIIN